MSKLGSIAKALGRAMGMSRERSVVAALEGTPTAGQAMFFGHDIANRNMDQYNIANYVQLATLPANAVADHTHAITPCSGTVLYNNEPLYFDTECGRDVNFHAEGFLRVGMKEDLDFLKKNWVCGNPEFGTVNIQWMNEKGTTKIANGGTEVEMSEINMRTPVSVSTGEDSDKNEIARILPNGNVILSSGKQISEAAAAFWSAIGRMNPLLLLEHIDFMNQAIQNAVDDCGCEGECEKCSVLLSSIPKVDPENLLFARTEKLSCNAVVGEPYPAAEHFTTQ